MAGKSIATIGSMHVCPMCSGTVPHVGGPVVGPGAPGVTINGQPIALVGDLCTCAGGPDTIVQGCPGVTVNGVPVAMVGSMTAHGGQITTGAPGVIISPNKPDTAGTSYTTTLKDIPFPKITPIDIIGAFTKGETANLKKAAVNIEQLKQEAGESKEKEPYIHNVAWYKEEKRINKAKELNQIVITANVSNINDGETVHFKLNRVRKSDGKEEVIELTGTAKNGKVETTWNIEEETNE